MSITLTRSKVKAEKVADVEAGIKRLIPTPEQAHQNMRYAWFRLEDGVTFVILVDTPTNCATRLEKVAVE
jgi:hypothetical protein